MGGRVAHGLLRVGGRVRGWEGGTRVTKGGRAGPWVGGWHTGSTAVKMFVTPRCAIHNPRGG